VKRAVNERQREAHLHSHAFAYRQHNIQHTEDRPTIACKNILAVSSVFFILTLQNGVT
jgi:hypothetical protein